MGSNRVQNASRNARIVLRSGDFTTVPKSPLLEPNYGPDRTSFRVQGAGPAGSERRNRGPEGKPGRSLNADPGRTPKRYIPGVERKSSEPVSLFSLDRILRRRTIPGKGGPDPRNESLN